MAMNQEDLTFWAGTTFTFDTVVYTATSISVSRSSQEFDVTHCGTGSAVTGFSSLGTWRGSEVENCEIKVDWVGTVVPQMTATALISFTGITAGQTGSIALATGLTMSASPGDLVRGSCTFKISYD